MNMGKKPLGTLWMRTDRAKENGECQILLRYFCRKYVFVSTGIYCKPEEWDAKKGIIKGSGRLIKEKNYHLTKTKEECDRKIMNYEGDINPVVIEKLLKNQASDKFFPCARQLWDEALETKSINANHHKVRIYQLSSFEKWADANGYKGMTVKDMVSGEFVRDWYAYQVNRMEASSIYIYLMSLICLFKIMRDKELITSAEKDNICRIIKSFRRAKEYNEVEGKEEKKWLNKEEIRRLESYECKDEQEQRVLDTFLFSLYVCGLRISDVLTLEWSHITDDGHIDKNQVKTKTKHKIAPMVNDKGMSILDRYRGKGKYVFGFFQDDDIIGGKAFYDKMTKTEIYINRVLKRIGKRVGIANLHPHMARHTATVMLLSSGMDTTTVAYLLGHANTAQVEKTYGDFLKEFKRSRAEQAADILNHI